MRRLFITALSALLFIASVAGAAEFLPGAKRLLILGDSITYAGQYVDRFELFLFTQYPERHFEVINVGLPSETVSGLSEEGHADGKFPRPDLHERLTRVLDKTKPDLVFACYGMNDGIYLPFDDGRFAKFQDGIRRLREAVAARGAKIIHLTPSIYDLEPRATSYDAVLAKYSQWLLEQRSAGWQVIDLHGPMSAAIDERRRVDPAFAFSKDHVHPNEAGHLMMADALLAGLGSDRLEAFQKLLAREWLASPAGKEYTAKIHKRGHLLLAAWLSETGHLRPGIAPGLPLTEATAQAAELERQIRETPVPR